MLSTSDLAKYPFTVEAADYLKEKELLLNDLADPTYNRAWDRAEERLKQAISDAMVSPETRDDVNEILSFPMARVLATMLSDERVARRYALAESKRASHLLANERSDVFLQIATNTFGWNIIADGETEFGGAFQLGFTEYIRNAARIRGPKWKLANRVLDKGYVLVTKTDAARLLEEEVQQRILQGIQESNMEQLDFLTSRMTEIKAFVEKEMGKILSEEMPSAAVSAAMPPCMRKLYEALNAGRSMPHISRFALTSFLVNIGATQDDILRVYRTAVDFDERKTRYQVEHIAGARGGKVRYTPPKCSTLKTHGICVSPDALCSEVKHPLTYYRRRLRSILKGGPKDQRD